MRGHRELNLTATGNEDAWLDLVLDEIQIELFDIYVYVRAYNYGILFRINFLQTHYKVSIDIGSQSIDR